MDVEEPEEDMRERVHASFGRQAMMKTLGAELTSVERGHVRITVPHDDRFTQQHGFMHAGSMAAVLDSACGYAAFSVMPPDAAVLTATYTINLMAPAAGQRFTMTAEVVRPGRTLVVCRGEAFADDSVKPFAAMQATMTVVRGKAGVSG
ncbi:MAG TPA: PaaI family thioesterase [Trebonia sp.]